MRAAYIDWYLPLDIHIKLCCIGGIDTLVLYYPSLEKRPLCGNDIQSLL